MSTFVVVALLIALVGYPLLCLFWPTTRCRWCDGTGKWMQPFSKRAYKPCRRCDGRGNHERLGRRLFRGLR